MEHFTFIQAITVIVTFTAGGSGLHDPFAPYQGWVPTYGCLRMQNADGEEVSRWIIDNGNNMLLEVVD